MPWPRESSSLSAWGRGMNLAEWVLLGLCGATFYPNPNSKGSLLRQCHVALTVNSKGHLDCHCHEELLAKTILEWLQPPYPSSTSISVL